MQSDLQTSERYSYFENALVTENGVNSYGICTVADKITFAYDGGMANAKSVLSVLGACVKCGDEIELTCEGVDEQEALDNMVAAIESGLGE